VHGACPARSLLISATPKAAFILLAWGFVFTVVDVQIGIDILPDSVGFGLIAIGARILGPLHSNFPKVSVYALGLALAALGLIFPLPFGLLGPRGAMVAQLAFWIGLSIAEVIMVYLICDAIRDFALKAKNWELARTAMARWGFYLGVPVFALFLVLIAVSGLMTPPGVVFLGLVLVGYSILVLVLMFSLLRTAYDKLDGLRAVPADPPATEKAEIRARDVAEVTILEVSGRVEAQDLTSIRALIEERLENGQRDFILSMAGVSELVSGGVGQLGDLVERARRRDARIRLVTRKKSKTHEALQRAVADDEVEIFGNEQDALASLVL